MDILVFSWKAETLPPGQMKGDEISDPRQYTELSKIVDWRKKLDNSWPVFIDISTEWGRFQFPTVDHAIVFLSYIRYQYPETFREFLSSLLYHQRHDTIPVKTLVVEAVKARDQLTKDTNAGNIPEPLPVPIVRNILQIKFADIGLRRLLYFTRTARLMRQNVDRLILQVHLMEVRFSILKEGEPVTEDIIEEEQIKTTETDYSVTQYSLKRMTKAEQLEELARFDEETQTYINMLPVSELGTILDGIPHSEQVQQVRFGRKVQSRANPYKIKNLFLTVLEKQPGESNAAHIDRLTRLTLVEDPSNIKLWELLDGLKRQNAEIRGTGYVVTQQWVGPQQQLMFAQPMVQQPTEYVTQRSTQRISHPSLRQSPVPMRSSPVPVRSPSRSSPIKANKSVSEAESVSVVEESMRISPIDVSPTTSQKLLNEDEDPDKPVEQQVVSNYVMLPDSNLQFRQLYTDKEFTSLKGFFKTHILVRLKLSKTPGIGNSIDTRIISLVNQGSTDSQIYENLHKFVHEEKRISAQVDPTMSEIASAVRGGNRANEALEILSPWLKTNRVSDYLDIGCNEGSITTSMGLGLGEGVNIRGVDIFETGSYDFEFTLIDESGNLPFEDSSQDVVTAYMSIHHVRNLDVLLPEIYRVLRPDGILLIREHDIPKKAFRLFLDLMHGMYARVWPVNQETEDFTSHYANYRSKLSLASEIESAGFVRNYSSAVKGPWRYYYEVYGKTKFTGFKIPRETQDSVAQESLVVTPGNELFV